MPKNTKGGKGHKRGAKTKQPFNKAKFRGMSEDGELFAKVISVHGNGMADVLCNDGVTRLLIIRRRFKGRNKRDNNIAVDVMVLVGLRMWSVVAEKKKQKVDLLYVYSKGDMDTLKKDLKLNPKILPEFVQIEETIDIGVDINSKHNWKKNMENEEEMGDTGENEEEKTKNSIQLDDFDFDDI